MKEIIAATKNKGKIAELRAAFSSLPIKITDLSQFGPIPEPEETGSTFAENAILKAKYYANITQKACLADDSGLEVDVLHGAPGVFSARYAGPNSGDAECNAKLLHELDGVELRLRTARFKCVLAFIDANQSVILTDGVCDGLILNESRGQGGFGYDPLFYIPDIGQTLAEVSMEEKNGLSHRGQAVRRMVAKLTQYMEK